MRTQHRHRRPMVIILAGLLGGVLLAVWILRPFLVPIAWAAILAAVCRPWTDQLTAKLQGRRRLAAALSCLLVSAIIILPLVFLAVVLAKQSVGALAHMQDLLQSDAFESAVRRRWDALVVWVFQASQGVVDWQEVDVRASLLEAMRNASGFLVSMSSAMMSRLLGGIAQLLLMIAVMYFLFLDGAGLLARLQAIIPLTHRQQRVLLSQFAEVSTAVLYGSFLTAIGQGLVGGLAFWLLGLPAPALWGTAMAAASMIPVVGSGLIWCPTAAYLLLTGEAAKGVILAGLGVGVIGLVDNAVRIFLMRGRMRMHILLVFLSILGGLRAFGFIGLVLGPMIIVMLQTFFLFYETELRKPADPEPNGQETLLAVSGRLI